MLNIQYGVCFGTVFSYLFYVVESPPTYKVGFVVDAVTFMPFAGILCYFFLDWVLANRACEVILNRKGLADSRLLLLSVGIWFLGVCVILVTSSDSRKYWIVACYFLVVGAYQLINFLVNFYEVSPWGQLVGYYLSTSTIVIGFYLLSVAIISASGVVEITKDLTEILPYVVWSVTAIKALHYFSFSTLAKGTNS